MKTITSVTRRAVRSDPATATLPSTSLPSPPNVRLEIGELVLRGFAGAEAQRVATATRTELTRLVIAHGLPREQGGNVDTDSVDGGSVRRVPSQPELTGRRVARAIYGGLRA
jgi:hypothetical protein